MKKFTGHYLWLSLKLLVIVGGTSLIMASAGVDWGVYLIPICLVLTVREILIEVSKMIDESNAEDVAV